MSGGACTLPCCDVTSKSLTRIPVDKENTTRVFGKKRRYYLTDWEKSHPWLYICSTSYKAFCFTCRRASFEKLVTFSHCGDPAFTENGFNNWKEAVGKYKQHEKSSFHIESEYKLSIRDDPNKAPVDECLKRHEDQQKLSRRQGLLERLKMIRIMTRQGIALRNVNEQEGNLQQFLQYASESCVGLKQLLQDNAYNSHQIDDELIKGLYRQSLNRLLDNIKAAEFFAIVVDETQDISGVEQLTFCLRWVSDDFIINEDFIGVHQADKCDAASIVAIIKNILLSLGVDLKKCRGQTYDGASVLQGALNGVGAQIRRQVPSALGVHCLNHSLQLIIQEAAAVNTLVRDAMSTVQTICNLVRASPKRLAMFKALQQMNNVHSSLKPLCPTRWTCRAKAIDSVLENYDSLIEAIEVIIEEGGSSEGAKLAPSLLKNMFDFGVFYALHMTKEIFSATELLAVGLQSKGMSAGDALRCKALLQKSLQSMREHANDFFIKVERKSRKFGVDAPTLPRWRRIPRKFDTGSENTRFTTPGQFFTTQYVEVIDLIVNKLDERFDQDTLSYLSDIEQTLVSATCENASAASSLKNDTKTRLSVDFDIEALQNELKLLKNILTDSKQRSIESVNDLSRALTPSMRQVYKNVSRLVRLFMTVPMSNATAERSFSSLRRIKTYLRNRLSQEHLNHRMFLNIHKELLDQVDLIAVCQEFVDKNDRRVKTFGKKFEI